MIAKTLEGSHGLWLMATRTRLLIAASGTGGHLAIALGTIARLQNRVASVPDRLETQLVPTQYPLARFLLQDFKNVLDQVLCEFWVDRFNLTCRQLLPREISRRVTTVILLFCCIAARLLGLPVILHEANALPGKVTRFFILGVVL